MQGTETKGLEEKLDDKTSGNAGFLGIKGNSEFRGRTFWAQQLPLAFDQSPARIPKGDRNCSKRKGTERMRQVVESQGPSAEATSTTPAT